MKGKGYRDLAVWNVAMELAESIYKLNSSLPADERFGLTSQVRRAAVSVPSNIAEGSGRASRGEFMQYLSIARGFLMELETQLTLFVRLNLIKRESAVEIWHTAARVGQMLNKLLAAIGPKTKP